MRQQYRSVTSSPNSKQSVRPHPLTQHLSLLHTASLFPVCSILLLLSGKLLKSPVDTASSTTSASWRRGFTALFWPGRRTPTTSGGGGISHGPRRVYRKMSGLPSTRLSWGKVCLSAIWFPPQALIKFQILSHLTEASLYTNSWSEHPQFWRKGTPTI